MLIFEFTIGGIRLPYTYISFTINHIVEDDVSGGPDCARNDILEEELDRWSQNYIDVNR